MQSYAKGFRNDGKSLFLMMQCLGSLLEYLSVVTILLRMDLLLVQASAFWNAWLAP